MISISGMGRFASIAVIAGSVMLVCAVRQGSGRCSEHLQAARAAIDALGVTRSFRCHPAEHHGPSDGAAYPGYPNLQDQISSTVEAEALKLAARRADLEREAALVYAKAFTPEELQAITTFYSSEAGKKLLKDGPIATRELLKAADIWTSGMGPRPGKAGQRCASEGSAGAQPAAEAPKP